MQDISPLHYFLRIAPNLETFVFDGRVEISFKTKRPTGTVLLNILDIDVLQCRLNVKNQSSVCNFSATPEKETLEVVLPKEQEGTFKLSIDYRGHINNLMAGFYRSRYLSGGREKYMAVTQFEESDARRAFPCMDHPFQKAVFDIEMDVDHGLTAISNEDVVREDNLENGKKRVIFKRTPKMSTYLVFLGVGEFDITPDNIDPRVRAVTLPGQQANAVYGMDFGRKTLHFSETYYGVPYPLSKMDLIAVPDFAFGAMENWGAITFRENLLLHYPGVTSKSGEARICEIIAHEIAHQWFGNLVTPEDWKYLWLNESFATFFGYGVVDHYYPEWETWSQFLQTMTATAMSRDALFETFAIEIPGGEHVVINAGTAPIIYNKGGSILRQIEGYIGTDNFRKGLQQYLKTYAYGCTASHHLWEAFESAAEKPVNAIMKSWVEQPGFPLISAKRSGDRLMLTQKRFTYLENTFEQTWRIPLWIQWFNSTGASDVCLVEMDAPDASVPVPADTVAYKVNTGQTGFYRVLYEDANDLQTLGKKIADRALPAEDRWGLQNDLFHLCLSGESNFEDYLSFLKYYEEETAYLPLSSIADNLGTAHHILEESSGKAIEHLAVPWYEKLLDHLGYLPAENEPHITAALREQLLSGAIRFGSEKTIASAMAQFDQLMKGVPVHADITKSIMTAGAWMGDRRTFDWFCERFQASEVEHERMNVLLALGMFRSKAEIQAGLQFVLDAVPPRNKFVPVVVYSTNPYAVPVLWKWYTTHKDAIEEQFHPMLYERVVGAVIPACGLTYPNEVKHFFETYLKQTDKAADVIRLSLERLTIHLRFRNRIPPISMQ